MELPLFLGGVKIDREGQRLSIIPRFRQVGICPSFQCGRFSPMLPDDSNPVIPFGQPHNRRVGGLAIVLSFSVCKY